MERESSSEDKFKEIVSALCSPAIDSKHRLKVVDIINEIECRHTDFVKSKFDRMKFERDAIMECCVRMKKELDRLHEENSAADANISHAKEEIARGHKDLVKELRHYSDSSKNLVLEMERLRVENYDLECSVIPFREKVVTMRRTVQTLKQECDKQEKKTENYRSKLVHLLKKENDVLRKLDVSNGRIIMMRNTQESLESEKTHLESRVHIVQTRLAEVRQKMSVLNTLLMDDISALQDHEIAVKRFGDTCSDHIVSSFV